MQIGQIALQHITFSPTVELTEEFSRDSRTASLLFMETQNQGISFLGGLDCVQRHAIVI